MGMLDWAEREIELACARERRQSDERTDCNYGIACLESALKAYKFLMEDEHSGFSIGVTMNFLNRLVERKPLTPIEDTPESWNETISYHDGTVAEWQCSRMSSLFKQKHWDNSITYRDIDRVVVTYADNPGINWHSGQTTKLIDEMFPITMPYWPSKGRYVVHAEEFLVDPKCDDYDTVGYLYVMTPKNERVEMNRYFKEDPDTHEWIEIDFNEYRERKAIVEANKEDSK